MSLKCLKSPIKFKSTKNPNYRIPHIYYAPQLFCAVLLNITPISYYITTAPQIAPGLHCVAYLYCSCIYNL